MTANRPRRIDFEKLLDVGFYFYYCRKNVGLESNRIYCHGCLYRLGKYSYARETDRSSSRALPPMNARLGMLEAIIMTVIPKQSQLKMVRFKILTEDHLYE